MTQKTIDILNNLNKQFYNETGSVVWNQKPDYYWEGWYQLTKFINESEKIELIKNKEDVIDKLPVGNEQVQQSFLATHRPKGFEAQADWGHKSDTAQNDSDGLDATENRFNTYKILDLGCGNARFVNFVSSELELEQVQNIEYLGVDFSVNFLEQSQSVNLQAFAKYQLKQLDILKELDQLKDLKLDLVVMFGLIHHIPSLQARKAFFAQVVQLLDSSGLLIFTTWQYLDTPRLIKRVIDAETETGKQVYQHLDIQKTDLEVGDNILDWVKKVFSYRYSHYFSQEEIQGYIIDNNLELIHSFVCDGRDSKRNRYFVCKKK
jgi:tRNA (uracil-5-)-methyltransferase TRM9